MSKDQSAYDHTSRTPGTQAEPDPSTEHRETADGDGNDRNELRPDERKRPEGPGPRPHDDTKVTRKDGA